MNWNDIISYLPLIMQWAAAVAIIAFLLDIFFIQCEIISYAAVFVIVIAAVTMIDMPVEWACVVIIITTLIAFYLLHLLWEKVLNPFFNKTLMRGVQQEAINEVVGQSGEFRRLGTSCFVNWNGELWPAQCEEPESFSNNEKVLITANKGGVFTIIKK